MKKSLLSFLAFFLVGTTPTYAEDLLGHREYWPNKSKADDGLLTRSENLTGLGTIAGAILGDAVSSSKNASAAGALVGFFGTGYLVSRTGKKEPNCRVVYVQKTDPNTGRNLAQQAVYCDSMVRMNVPTAPISAPEPASYYHGSSEATATSLPESPPERVASARCVRYSNGRTNECPEEGAPVAQATSVEKTGSAVVEGPSPVRGGEAAPIATKPDSTSIALLKIEPVVGEPTTAGSGNTEHVAVGDTPSSAPLAPAPAKPAPAKKEVAKATPKRSPNNKGEDVIGKGADALCKIPIIREMC